jgi:DNA polymerase III subunit delta
MDHLKIIRDIQMRNFKPVYLLSGDEPYFIDLITDYIEEHVLDEAERTFGQTILYGRDVSMEQVLSVAKSFPMGSALQVVIVKEAQDMKEWKSVDDQKNIEHYVQRPTPSTLLVFCLKHKKIDRRTKLFKLIEKNGVFFLAEQVKDYKMADWIASYTRDRGYKIEGKSAELIAEYLGNDLSKVVNAINKLAVILPAGSTISGKHIEEYIGISKDYSVWELTRALGEKDIFKANRIIDYFSANPKNYPIQKIIPGLYVYFMKLAVYQTLEDKSKAAQVLEAPQPAINEMRQVEKRFTAQKLERIIGYLRDADRKSKGIDNDFTENEDLLKELVFKILH